MAREKNFSGSVFGVRKSLGTETPLLGIYAKKRTSGRRREPVSFWLQVGHSSY